MSELLKAFQTVGPLTGDLSLDRLRNVAAVALFKACQSLMDGIRLAAGLSQPDRQDAIATVLVRLVQSGPRGDRVGDPCDDAAVRGFLRQCLQNAIRDQYRSRQRQGAQGSVALDEPDDVLVDPVPTTDELVDQHRAGAAIQRAWSDLDSLVLPSIQREMRADGAARLTATMQELSGLYRGEADFDALCAQDAAANADRKVLRKARNARYQRYHRALAAVTAQVDLLRRSGQLTDTRCEALRALLSALHLRQPSEPSP